MRAADAQDPQTLGHLPCPKTTEVRAKEEYQKGRKEEEIVNEEKEEKKEEEKKVGKDGGGGRRGGGKKESRRGRRRTIKRRGNGRVHGCWRRLKVKTVRKERHLEPWLPRWK